MREFTDAQGRRWRAQLISRGRTSGYLTPRVHRPIVQFTCLDQRLPVRYGGYPRGQDDVDDVSESRLVELLEQSSVH